MQKYFSLIIKASQDFIRHTDDDVRQNAPVLNSFYESITNVYIPLLNMLERFEKEEKKIRIGLVLPPVLCNMLSDDYLKEAYVKWLDKRIDLGKAELKRNNKEEAVCNVIHSVVEENKARKADFLNKYESSLIPAFAKYMQNGYLELL